MGRWLLLPALLLSVPLPGEVSAVCCEQFYDAIYYYFGATGWIYMPVCADGKRVRGYSPACGKYDGACNFFGCNCDGGCATGALHRAGQPDATRFVCDSDTVLPDESLTTLMAHPNCSCLINQPFKHYVSSAESVAGPEVLASEPKACPAEAAHPCQLQITDVQSFAVTTAVPGGATVELPDEVKRPAIGFDTSWTTATAAETVHWCMAEPGSVVRLAVKPMYFKLQLIELINEYSEDPDWRPRCKLTAYFVPQILPDRSIKGQRRCAVQAKEKACPNCV